MWVEVSCKFKHKLWSKNLRKQPKRTALCVQGTKRIEKEVNVAMARHQGVWRWGIGYGFELVGGVILGSGVL